MDEDEELATLLERWTTLQEQYVEVCQQAIVRQQQDMEEAMMLYDRETRTVHKRTVKEKDKEEMNARLMKDYFTVPSEVYTDTYFRRRNMMHRSLFLRILEDIQNDNRYFQQHPNAVVRLGLSGHQKMMCAMRLLAYGRAADSVDENCRIGETTTIETLKTLCKHFSNCIRGSIYEDLHPLMCNDYAATMKNAIFLECSEVSIACIESGRTVRLNGRHNTLVTSNPNPTIILEAVADKDAWFWHANFGMAGSNNNLNVLHTTDLFDEF